MIRVRRPYASRVTPQASPLGIYVLRVTLYASCLVLPLPTPSHAWLNPTRDQVAEANRLYKQGQYDEALTKYGDALLDQPDSPLLNFNMGAAKYKAGKYDEATASFARVRTDDQDSVRAAKVAYNIGNAQYRLGAALEADKPQEALQAYAGALVAYRRALGADPTDEDTKFNYEFVTKRIDDLKKKLEEEAEKEKEKEQQQEQEQPQDEQQQEEPQQCDNPQEQQDEPQQCDNPQEGGQDQQAQSSQEQEQPHGPDGEQEQQQARQGEEPVEQPDDQQAAAEQAPGEQPSHQQEADSADAGGEEERTGEMSRHEAQALLDAARNDELRPDQFIRQMQGGRVAEPAYDW